MLDIKNPEPDAPKKRPKPDSSGPNGNLRVDHNGKVNITMNAAMLGLLATLVFKVWTTFTQMHTDVNEAKASLGDLVMSVEKLGDSVAKAANDIEAVKAEKQKDAEAASKKSEEIEARFKSIERCLRKPKDCQL